MQKASSPSRRKFLEKAASGTAAAVAAGIAGPPALADGKCDDDGLFGHELPSFAANRCKKSFEYRVNVAKMARDRRLVWHVDNGDEDLYANKIGSYSKVLPHNQLGEVDLAAYATLVKARQSRNPADFEAIQMGEGRKLESPQAGLAMDTVGADSHHVTLPAAPKFSSAEAAGEAVELYWMALLRDVNFADYATHPLVAQAANELSTLSDFRGPREGGRVTANTIFRGPTPGDLAGPLISQFLLQDFFFGANPFSARMRTRFPGDDAMTQYAEWLAIQNGAAHVEPQYDPTYRYIRNLRDLAEWSHRDALYQGYLQAAMILLGSGARLDPGLPLANSRTQSTFAQCGGMYLLGLVPEVSTRALKAVWYQKWYVQNRLRPEEYGGRVHNHLTGAANYPLHPEVLNSQAVAATFSKYGTYLLPQAYREGSPPHPAYASGHATVAGACVTILKAFFDETDTVRNPVVPNADGTALVPYEGRPLTVGGELNKVAMNVATGRNAAGIHWRTDAVNGIRLGEEVAITILEEQKRSFNGTPDMTLTQFDGTTITI